MIKYAKNIVRSRRRAVILIGVLWMIAMMIIVTTVLARTGRVDTHASMLTAERIRCKWACRSGFEVALSMLSEDDLATDTVFDTWYDNIEDFNDIQLDRSSVMVRVYDEAAKLNINFISKEQIAHLYDADEQVIDSILDWRDADSDIRAYGAEQGYYQQRTPPYMCRNGHFDNIRELLFVRGVTQNHLYGSGIEGDLNENGWIGLLTTHSFSPNRDSDGTKRLNINSADENKIKNTLNISASYAKWIVEERPQKGYGAIGDLVSNKTPDKPSDSSRNSNQASAIDFKTFLEIADKITTHEEEVIPGQLNINTASREVLKIFFQGNEELADEIIRLRDESVIGLTSFADLQNARGFTKQICRNNINWMTLRSSVFTIHATAEASTTGITSSTEAIVRRDQNKNFDMIYYYAGVNN